MIKLELRPTRWLRTAHLEKGLSRLIYVCDGEHLDKGMVVASKHPALYLQHLEKYLRVSKGANEKYTMLGRKVMFAIDTPHDEWVGNILRRFIIDNGQRDLLVFAIGTCDVSEVKEGKKKAMDFVKELLESNTFEPHTSLGQYLRA